MLQIGQLAQITKRSGFQKYLKNTSWLLAEKVLRLVSGLVVGVLVARYLGPADYGLYNYAFSIVAIFSAVAALGLNQIVVRELVKNPDDTPTLLGTSFILKLAGSVLSFLLAALTIILIEDDSISRSLVIVIGFSVIFTSFNVIDYYFQSKVESKFLLFSNMISLTIASAAKIYLIIIEGPLLAFAWVVVIESFVLSIALSYYFIKVRKRYPIFQWNFSSTTAKELLKDSWPLIFGGLVLMIQSRIDQLMLKEMISNEVVGHYSVALRMVEVFGFIPMMLQSSLLPSLINSKKASLSLFKSRLSNYYRLNFIFFIVIALPLFIFSDEIVGFLFGEAYMPAAILLALMSIRLLFSNMGVARGTYVIIGNLTKFSLLTMTIGTAINVVLNYIWIPKFEAIGSVYATIVSFVFTIFVIDFFHKKARWNVLIMLIAMLTFFKIRLDFLSSDDSNPPPG